MSKSSSKESSPEPSESKSSESSSLTTFLLATGFVSATLALPFSNFYLFKLLYSTYSYSGSSSRFRFLSGELFVLIFIIYKFNLIKCREKNVIIRVPSCSSNHPILNQLAKSKLKLHHSFNSKMLFIKSMVPSKTVKYS